MTDWISVIVVAVIVIFFIAIMYRALKEPIDLVLSGIGYVLSMIAEAFSGPVETVEVITYE